MRSLTCPQPPAPRVPHSPSTGLPPRPTWAGAPDGHPVALPHFAQLAAVPRCRQDVGQHDDLWAGLAERVRHGAALQKACRIRGRSRSPGGGRAPPLGVPPPDGEKARTWSSDRLEGTLRQLRSAVRKGRQEAHGM